MITNIMVLKIPTMLAHSNVLTEFTKKTFRDTYSKVAQAKLYTTKTPITTADTLNDKFLPFYEENDLPLLRILTDRGTEYFGRADQYDCQYIWHLMILNTLRPNYGRPKQMVYVNAFIRQY